MGAHASRKGSRMAKQPNIVLVHGAWADGSSWSAAIERLQAAGYRVTAPQFPMTKLADDVDRLRQVLARQDGPTVVVGHSYGGQIITALGEDAPNVVGLVYMPASGLTKANRSEPCWDKDLRPRRSRTLTSTSKASLGCPRTTS